MNLYPPIAAVPPRATVADLAIESPKTLPPSATVHDVRELFRDDHVHMVLLTSDGYLRGCVELPDRVAVSVITIGELELGVLAALSDDARARRADTLALARESDPLPVSESVMTAWAHLVADCRRAGVQRTVRLTDALIAATAIAHGLPVVTQHDDFDQMAVTHSSLRVIKV